MYEYSFNDSYLLRNKFKQLMACLLDTYFLYLWKNFGRNKFKKSKPQLKNNLEKWIDRNTLKNEQSTYTFNEVCAYQSLKLRNI